MEFREPLLGRGIGGDLDHAAVQGDHPLTSGADHTETGIGSTRIDADDDHLPSFSLAPRMSFNCSASPSRCLRKEKGPPGGGPFDQANRVDP